MKHDFNYYFGSIHYLNNAKFYPDGDKINSSSKYQLLSQATSFHFGMYFIFKRKSHWIINRVYNSKGNAYTLMKDMSWQIAPSYSFLKILKFKNIFDAIEFYETNIE